MRLWFSHQSWRELNSRQREVLQAVGDGRIERGWLLGEFEPHTLDGRPVDGTLRQLALRALIMFRSWGTPILTLRGRAVLDEADAPPD